MICPEFGLRKALNTRIKQDHFYFKLYSASLNQIHKHCQSQSQRLQQKIYEVHWVGCLVYCDSWQNPVLFLIFFSLWEQILEVASYVCQPKRKQASLLKLRNNTEIFYIYKNDSCKHIISLSLSLSLSLSHTHTHTHTY